MGVAKGVANMGLRAGVEGVMLLAGEVGLEISTGPVMSHDYHVTTSEYIPIAFKNLTRSLQSYCESVMSVNAVLSNDIPAIDCCPELHLTIE